MLSHYTKRQQEIINIAIDLMARKGVQELTIKNLSQKIGIVESAIYRHFKSKQDILLGILNIFKENKEEIFAAIEEVSSSPLAQLHILFNKRFEHFSKNPAVASVIFSEDFFRNDKRLSQMVYDIMQINQSIIIDIVKRGQLAGEIRNDLQAKQLSFILTGALRLIVTQWRLSEFDFDLVAEGRNVWQTLEKMIKK
jgi:AcrR family transcriptional regulator